MNIFHKIFRNKTKANSKEISSATQKYIDNIQAATNDLWEFLEKALDFYHLTSCQCAFPRYRQIVSINMSELGGSFYVSETEGFIKKSEKYFNVLKVDGGNELSNEIWTCKKCNSTFEFGWSDFSIYVNRSFLKLMELKTSNIGADIMTPIPLFVGPFGHKYPESNVFAKVTLEKFKTYILEKKNGH